LVFRKSAVERELDEELAFHIAMETDRSLRAGMTDEDARRQAVIAFGGVERHKEEVRAARILGWVSGMSLDFKLGLRMMARYPGLSLVSVATMAFGIAAAAAPFEFVKDELFRPYPYTDARRIVAIGNVDIASSRPVLPTAREFDVWRRELRSVSHLSAFVARERELSLATEPMAAVTEVAVSANAFALVSTPVLGRALIPGDEAANAAPVAVIGYELWQKRFGGAKDVLGRVIRLDGEPTTVVGVMGENFMFVLPGARSGPGGQDLWVPFRSNPLAYARDGGPAITVFGRLTPGVTLEMSRAELAALATVSATESRDTDERLKPSISTLSPGGGGSGWLDGLLDAGVLGVVGLLLLVLLVILCVNIALLIYARAATREREIATRSALGASRGRIVFQLFAESLVLAVVAAGLGLAAASALLRWMIGLMRTMAEINGTSVLAWLGDDLSWTTIGYTVLLLVAASAIIGVLPGLKATSGWTQPRLQELGQRGAQGMGRLWTGIIIMQVALTVMVVPVAALLGIQTWGLRSMELGVRGNEYLAVWLESRHAAAFPDATSAPVTSRSPFEGGLARLADRLRTESGVTGVALANRIPGQEHGRARLEFRGVPALTPSESEPTAQVAAVDPGFFTVIGARIVSGRGLNEADVRSTLRVVVVNESFVRNVLQGRSPIGVRVRYAGSPESAPWSEIVGVVQDLAMSLDPMMPDNAGMYRPLDLGTARSASMIVHLTESPGAMARRVRALALATDPGLRVARAVPLDQTAEADLVAYDAWFRVIVLGAAVALLLTNAGIYAVISLTVSRRTREIGIRIALGAVNRQIVTAILSNMARHVAIGVLAGSWLSVLLAFALSRGAWRPPVVLGGTLLLAYGILMMGMCMVACVVPIRRALRIQPMEALATTD
jgi:predicted permease